jgi:hypothetical protein
LNRGSTQQSAFSQYGFQVGISQAAEAPKPIADIREYLDLPLQASGKKQLRQNACIVRSMTSIILKDALFGTT